MEKSYPLKFFSRVYGTTAVFDELILKPPRLGDSEVFLYYFTEGALSVKEGLILRHIASVSTIIGGKQHLLLIVLTGTN